MLKVKEEEKKNVKYVKYEIQILLSLSHIHKYLRGFGGSFKIKHKYDI